MRGDPPVPLNSEFKLFPIRKMAAQGERGQGGIGFNIESMARDGSFYYNPTTNCSQWGCSPSYTEHELCQQTNSKSQNSGAAAPQRNMERAAINSTMNGTTRGMGSQPPVQTTWSWQARQANIGGLRTQWVKEIKRERQEQLKKKARLKYAEIVKEQRMKQEKEIGQLKETMRLENEEHERQ